MLEDTEPVLRGEVSLKECKNIYICIYFYLTKIKRLRNVSLWLCQCVEYFNTKPRFSSFTVNYCGVKTLSQEEGEKM